jgi:hypothetical protein
VAQGEDTAVEGDRQKPDEGAKGALTHERRTGAKQGS